MYVIHMSFKMLIEHKPLWIKRKDAYVVTYLLIINSSINFTIVEHNKILQIITIVIVKCVTHQLLIFLNYYIFLVLLSLLTSFSPTQLYNCLMLLSLYYFLQSRHKLLLRTYGTAQRQLDTRTRVAG